MCVYVYVCVREKERERERERERETNRLKNATLLALEMEEVAISQGIPGTSRSWKRQGDKFSFRASRRNVALPTP